MTTITVEVAYAAMFIFLDRYNGYMKSDVLGGLLGSMSTMSDGLPLDQGMWHEWLEAIEAAKSGSVDISLKLE